jgi:hypothetical protein
MPEEKIHRLSLETRQRCQQIIQQNSWVYIARIPIAKALGDGQFEYLGPLADKNNSSTLSTLRNILHELGIIRSRDDDITEYLYNSSQQHNVSPPPAELVVISRIQKESARFCFCEDDATAIKDALKKIGLAQRRLVHPRMHNHVENSLNKQPVPLLDFIQILKALIKKNIVTLNKGQTIESLLKLPHVDENNPLRLSKDDIHFRKRWIFLSEKIIETIHALLLKKKVDLQTLVDPKSKISEKTLRSFLRGASIQRHSFLEILNLLADHGVLETPKTGFDQFLSNARNETSNPTVSNTATACASAGPNSNPQAATLAAALEAQGRSAGS